MREVTQGLSCDLLAPVPPCHSNSNKHPPRCAVSKHRVVGGRLASLTCLAENEASSGLTAAVGQCCNASQGGGSAILSSQWRAPDHMKWPQAFLQAVEAQLSSDRPIDFNFIGAISGDTLTERSRRWVLEFALKRFTNASVFVDTTPRSTDSRYRPLGVWDRTLSHPRYRPKDPQHSRHGGCSRIACDAGYLGVLARSRYTLAPMGDQPWSHRYFEAVMAGSIPVVESHLHAGRTAAERALGYHHLLAGSLPPAPETPTPGEELAPYCAARAAANRQIFFARQTALPFGSHVIPDVAPCSRPPFAMPTEVGGSPDVEPSLQPRAAVQFASSSRPGRTRQQRRSPARHVPPEMDWPAAPQAIGESDVTPRRRVIGRKGKAPRRSSTR